MGMSLYLTTTLTNINHISGIGSELTSNSFRHSPSLSVWLREDPNPVGKVSAWIHWNLFESKRSVFIKDRTKFMWHDQSLISEMDCSHSQTDKADKRLASCVQCQKYRIDLWMDREYSDACMNYTMNNPIRMPNRILFWWLLQSQYA